MKCDNCICGNCCEHRNEHIELFERILEQFPIALTSPRTIELSCPNYKPKECKKKK